MRASVLLAFVLPAVSVLTQQITLANQAACAADYVPAVRTIKVLECIPKSSIKCDLGSGGGTGAGTTPSTIHGTVSDSGTSSNIGGTGNTAPDTVIHSATPSSGTGTDSDIVRGSSGDISDHSSAAAEASGASEASQSGAASSGATNFGAGASVAGSGAAGAGDIEYCPSFTVGQNYTLEIGSGRGITRWAWVSGTSARTGVPTAPQRANPLPQVKFRIEHIPNTRCRFVIYSASAVPGPAYLKYEGDHAHGKVLYGNWIPGRQGAAEVLIGRDTNEQFRITIGPASDGTFARLDIREEALGLLRFSPDDVQTLWKIMPVP